MICRVWFGAARWWYALEDSGVKDMPDIQSLAVLDGSIRWDIICQTSKKIKLPAE